jgi:hypothetical protein
MGHPIFTGYTLHKAYAVRYVDGVRRRTLGLAALSCLTTRVGLHGRLGFAVAHRLPELQEALHRSALELEFKANTAASTCPGGAPEFDLRK